MDRLRLTGVLSVVIMNNMALQTKSQKTFQLQQGVNDIQRLFQDLVSRREPCEASFSAVEPGQTLTELRTSKSVTGSQAFAEVGKEFQASGLIIKEMRLLDLKEMQLRKLPLPDLDPYGIGHTYLRVVLEKKGAGSKQSFMGGKEVAFTVRIKGKFTFDASVISGNDKPTAVTNWIAYANTQIANMRTQMIADGVSPLIDPKPYRFESADSIQMTEASVVGFQDSFGYFMPGDPGEDLVWPLIHPNYPMSECGDSIKEE